MKNKKWLSLLLIAPVFNLSAADIGDNDINGKTTIQVVSMAAFAAAENCRNRSLVLREAVNAKDHGLEIERVLGFAGNDEPLKQLIRRAYESDTSVNEMEDSFYEQCIEESKSRINQL